MALKVPQSSFSAGELDPILHERTTLAKFKTGLATLRNWIVGKTGSIFTRPGRSHYIECKLENRRVKFYSPPTTGYLIEWGHLYMRVYSPDGVLLHDLPHLRTEDELDLIKFDTNGDLLYVFCRGQYTYVFHYVGGVALFDPFSIPAAGVSIAVTPSGAPSGYAVDYAVSYVQNGQESLPQVLNAAGLLPISAGQSNVIDLNIGVSGVALDGVTEARFYRRPNGGGVFGFIGASTLVYDVGPNLHAFFTDIGGAADYTHTPVSIVEPNSEVPMNYKSAVGAVYQQRLILSLYPNLEGLIASRPGLKNNFFKDSPINSDSALKFRAGSSGYAKVYDLLDSDGLVVFTSQGIFLHTGTLAPENLALVKKGKWIIKEDVRALAVPGGVFFVDEASNNIRNLVWSQELASFNGEEVTIFSNHLFQKRAITSWAFHEGSLPLLWVTFDDGTYASFTYEFDQEMKAWARHDSTTFVEQVIGTGLADKTYFLVKNGSKRYVEVTNSRFIRATEFNDNPEADKSAPIAFMDSMVTYQNLLNDQLVGADEFYLTPVTPEEWDGPMTLTCGTSPIFTVGGAGEIGSILRVFDSDKTAYDLEVTARASNSSVTVRPNILFPEYMRSNPRLYLTTLQVTGLGHMEGELASIIVDGAVVASPNNDIDNLDDITVNDGRINLPERFRGAIIHVGRPIAAGDVETLDIDTVEQAPTLIESKTVNKLYIKAFESRDLYVGHKFPPNNKVNTWTEDPTRALQKLESMLVDYEDEEPIIGNRYPQPQSERYEVSLPGDWRSNGRIVIRKVDPTHSQILSIIPDVEVLSRSDR